METEQNETTEYSGDAQGLRQAGRDLAEQRGASASPPEPTEVKVVDEGQIKRDFNGDGSERGMNARDLGEHLKRYHDALRTEKEEIAKIMKPEEPPSEDAPTEQSWTSEEVDAAPRTDRRT